MKDKKIFLKMIEAQEKEWESQINKLQSKAASFEAKSRMEYENQMDTLNEKLKEAQKHMNEIKKTNDEKWHEIGEKTSHAWNDLTSKIEHTINKLKEHK